MSSLQPTLAEAEATVAFIERMIAAAVDVRPERWHNRGSRVIPDGVWVREKRLRYGMRLSWPMSDVSQRCDVCRRVLRARRDAGCQGFYFDDRWLKGNPAVRDPRHSEEYQPRYACLGCFNRVRRKIQKAEAINEVRLLINRIVREARRVEA